MTDPAYHYIYNVGLLDDLHNYFPAFLYDSGRFQSLPQVFSYMRTQLNNRFNLHSYGARQAGFVAPVQAQPAVQVQAPPLIGTPGRGRPLDATTQYLAEILVGMRDINPVLSDGVSYFFTQPVARGQAGQAFSDPVPIRPSAEVLARNTTLLSGSDLDENSRCAICQDSIVATDACRKLNGCLHSYHRGCIDQWFQTNAICPSCRHDVRENVVPGRRAADVAATDAEEDTDDYVD
jgi:hypothetical protein